MAKSTSKSDPKSFDLGALELASKKYAIKDPVIIHRATDKLRKSQEDIFQLRVVSLADANGLQYPLVMNAAGEELDLDALRERDRIDYFGARKAPAAGFRSGRAGSGITINPTENHLTLNEGDTFDEVIRVTVPPNAGSLQS